MGDVGAFVLSRVLDTVHNAVSVTEPRVGLLHLDTGLLLANPHDRWIQNCTVTTAGPLTSDNAQSLDIFDNRWKLEVVGTDSDEKPEYVVIRNDNHPQRALTISDNGEVSVTDIVRYLVSDRQTWRLWHTDSPHGTCVASFTAQHVETGFFLSVSADGRPCISRDSAGHVWGVVGDFKHAFSSVGMVVLVTGAVGNAAVACTCIVQSNRIIGADLMSRSMSFTRSLTDPTLRDAEHYVFLQKGPRPIERDCDECHFVVAVERLEGVPEILCRNAFSGDELTRLCLPEASCRTSAFLIQRLAELLERPVAKLDLVFPGPCPRTLSWLDGPLPLDELLPSMPGDRASGASCSANTVSAFARFL